MQKGQNLTEIGEKEDTVVDFKTRKAVATGSGSGGDSWLGEIEVGSIFLARPKIKLGQQVDAMNRLMLNSYLLQDRRDEEGDVSVCNLIWRLPDGNQMDIWVPTLEFSRNLELVKVLVVVDFGNKVLKEEVEELSSDE